MQGQAKESLARLLRRPPRAVRHGVFVSRGEGQVLPEGLRQQFAELRADAGTYNEQGSGGSVDGHESEAVTASSGKAGGIAAVTSVDGQEWEGPSTAGFWAAVVGPAAAEGATCTMAAMGPSELIERARCLRAQIAQA